MGRIDLSKVPKDKLEEIAINNGIEIQPRERINSIRMKLYQNIDSQELYNQTHDYIFAGRTSSVYYKYEPIEGRTSTAINRDSIEGILRNMCNGENPYDLSRRPELTNNFRVINAQFLEDSKLLVSFAKKGHDSWFLDGYNFKTMSKTDWINCFLYLNDNVFEARSAIDLAKKCSNCFFNMLNRDDEYVHNTSFLMVGEQHFLPLKNELNARVRTYKGRDITERYHTREITGHRDDDLYSVDGFNDDIDNLDTPNSKLIFDSPINPGYEIVIRVNTQKGYITFLSPYTSEGDMDYVYNALKNIGVIR